MAQDEQIKRIEAKIAEFQAWKEARTSQQLVFPLDKQSQDIISADALKVTGDSVVPVSLLSADTALEVRTGGNIYWLLASPAP